MAECSQEGLFHIARVQARLADTAVKQAFEKLMTALEHHKRFEIVPSSRGNFSVTSLCLDGRRSMAFRGTKSWIAWYFRKPGFEQRLFSRQNILENFRSNDPFEDVRVQENRIKLRTETEAQDVLRFTKAI